MNLSHGNFVLAPKVCGVLARMEINMEEKLICEAIRARELAYCPYSNYRVGAALLTRDGRIFTGCNIENASYGATNCAERTAIFKAVSEGVRTVKMIAIVGGHGEDADDYAFPCGICRQVLREFCDPTELIVLVAKNTRDYKKMTLDELLPESFGPDNLN